MIIRRPNSEFELRLINQSVPRHVSYDTGACVCIGNSLGFKGIYPAEYRTAKLRPTAPVRTTKRIIEVVVEDI